MVEIVSNKHEFKKINKNCWKSNAEFVLNYGFPHIDLENLLEEQINKVVSKFNNINSLLDIGCGSGWLKKIIDENKLNYKGVDNCKVFINKNSQNFPNSFFELDIEDEIEKSNINKLKSDILVCSLSLIEIPHLNKAFENLSKLCKEKGYLFIISLNPIIELYRVSESFEEFNRYLKLYREEGMLSISKKIKSGKVESKEDYHRILYRVSDYIKGANEYGFSLIDYIDDFNKNDLGKEPMYQFLLLQKK